MIIFAEQTSHFENRTFHRTENAFKKQSEFFAAGGADRHCEHRPRPGRDVRCRCHPQWFPEGSTEQGDRVRSRYRRYPFR